MLLLLHLLLDCWLHRWLSRLHHHLLPQLPKLILSNRPTGHQRVLLVSRNLRCLVTAVTHTTKICNYKGLEAVIAEHHTLIMRPSDIVIHTFLLLTLLVGLGQGIEVNC